MEVLEIWDNKTTSSLQVDVNLKITISAEKSESERDIHVSALLNRKIAIGTVSGRIVNREQLVKTSTAKWRSWVMIARIWRSPSSMKAAISKTNSPKKPYKDQSPSYEARAPLIS